MLQVVETLKRLLRLVSYTPGEVSLRFVTTTAQHAYFNEIKEQANRMPATSILRGTVIHTEERSDAIYSSPTFR